MEVVSEEQLANTVALNFIDELKKNASVDVIQYPNGLGDVGLCGLRPGFECSINPQLLVLVDGRPIESRVTSSALVDRITKAVSLLSAQLQS
ncbi:hypothetical protein HGI47_21635 [Novosphingobium sp. ERN07]|uniref:hypothetical protein n=1 Tax=Novosphingobium sp. ERN07 TaxID=2726187 RepID=UPI0014571130|nr:hypothetical protein [Novosphingobium sp. ERN07]NLR73466.1 hypothetical protein [Novosphingobium sp. ERN07]